MSSEMRIARKPRVRELTCLSDATIYRLEKAGKFPKRVQLSTFAVGWIEGDVLAWIEAKRSASGA